MSFQNLIHGSNHHSHMRVRSTSILIDRSPASAATGGIEWLEQKSCALCYHHELVHVLSPVVGDYVGFQSVFNPQDTSKSSIFQRIFPNKNHPGPRGAPEACGSQERDSPLRVYIASFYFCSTLAVHKSESLSIFDPWLSWSITVVNGFQINIQPIHTRLFYHVLIKSIVYYSILFCFYVHLTGRSSHMQPRLYGYAWLRVTRCSPKINNPRQPSIRDPVLSLVATLQLLCLLARQVTCMSQQTAL